MSRQAREQKIRYHTFWKIPMQASLLSEDEESSLMSQNQKQAYPAISGSQKRMVSAQAACMKKPEPISQRSGCYKRLKRKTAMPLREKRTLWCATRVGEHWHRSLNIAIAEDRNG